MLNTMNTIKSRNRNLILYSLIVFIAVVIASCVFLYKPDYQLRIIKCELGWGYFISNNRDIIIYQDYIPVYEGIKAFPTKRAAKKTGKLVMKKLQEGKQPVITRNELDNILK